MVLLMSDSMLHHPEHKDLTSNEIGESYKLDCIYDTYLNVDWLSRPTYLNVHRGDMSLV
jgi:hypothetical protein